MLIYSNNNKTFILENGKKSHTYCLILEVNFLLAFLYYLLIISWLLVKCLNDWEVKTNFIIILKVFENPSS